MSTFSLDATLWEHFTLVSPIQDFVLKKWQVIRTVLIINSDKTNLYDSEESTEDRSKQKKHDDKYADVLVHTFLQG